MIIDRKQRVLYASQEIYSSMPPGFLRKKAEWKKDTLEDVIPLTASDRYRLKNFVENPEDKTVHTVSLVHGVYCTLSPVFLHEFLVEFFLFEDNLEMYEEYMYYTGNVIRTDRKGGHPQSENASSNTVQSVSRIILDAADEFIAAVSENEVLESFNTVVSKIFSYDSIDILLRHMDSYHLIYSRNSVTGEMYEYSAAALSVYTGIFEKSDVPLILGNEELRHDASGQTPFPGLSAMQSALIIPVQRSGKLVGITVIGFRYQQHLSPFYADIVHGITCLAYMSYDNFISRKNRRKLESEVRRHEKLISLGGIVAGVAHEINNPLSIMQLDIEELSQLTPESVNAQLPEITDSLSQEMARIKALLQHLRDYVQPEECGERIGSETCEICELFKRYPLKIMLKSYRKKGISINVHCRQKMTAQISRRNIEQVLMNIVGNAFYAVQHNDRRGEITIQAYTENRAEGSLHCIEIRDNGIGIAPEDLDSIFDPFFTTKQAEGTGLGLSISYSIIKKNNGDISVWSVPGKGTAITVKLPVIAAAAS